MAIHDLASLAYTVSLMGKQLQELTENGTKSVKWTDVKNQLTVYRDVVAVS